MEQLLFGHMLLYAFAFCSYSVPFQQFASLTNGCVTRLVCWWAWSCLSAPASNLHRWLASCLQHHEKESIVHQSLPASTQPIHSKSYAVPSRSGRCHWVPWGPNTESATVQERICMTLRWSRRMRTSKVPTAATAEVIQKLFRVQMFTPRHTLAEKSWLTRQQDRLSTSHNTNRRQKLLGSEDSLGCQQGAEDAEWPSLARGRGDSTTLAGHLSRRRKTSNRNQVAAGASPDLPEGRKTQRKTRFKGHPLMSPATEGGEQWPMWRVLPTKPIVHAPTTLWPCNYLWNGVVLSFWIVAGERQRQAPSLKGAQPQLLTATLTPLVWPWMGRVGRWSTSTQDRPVECGRSPT